MNGVGVCPEGLDKMLISTQGYGDDLTESFRWQLRHNRKSRDGDGIGACMGVLV